MFVTVNDPQVISAATMLTFMHLYFLSDARADKREIVTAPFNLAIINPWIEHLQSHGAKILVKSPVSGLKFERGRIVSCLDDPTEYDHYILSTDIPGARRILKGSRFDEFTNESVQKLNDTANLMGVAPPYKVMRVWFNGRLNANRPNILETPQHRPFNLIARYDLLEDEFIEWAESNNGTIVL